ncbi:MAG: sensor histidine kinase [Chloroflexota bacterium]
MRSVAWRVLFACLLAAGVAVGTVAVVFNRAASEGFRTYVQTGSTQYALRVGQDLADYYARNGSWQGVEALLPALTRPFDDRLVVADANGVIVADTAGTGVGSRAAQLGLGQGTAILADRREVGSYYLPSSTVAGRGQGAMGRGMGPMMGQGNASQPVTTPEDVFVETVNRGLALGAGAAVLLAILLSFLLSRQIVRPLEALASASGRLAAGDHSPRVEVRSQDELGTVATAFNAMAESLDRNEQTRRQLLADVAHELRTPLTIIEGTADGILDGVLEPTPEQIGVIKEEADLLTQLVADLRDLSLAEAGQLRLDLSRLDAGELVARVVRGFEPAAQRKGVRLTMAAAELPAVEADATRLAQAVGNLLSNAIRHTPAEGEVRVSVGGDTAAAGRVLISVADTGEGIAAADLPLVFERFYRVDKSRARRSGGSGLGLAIAKQIVAGHGGRIWAESTPGRGSTFFIEVPAPRPS